MTKPERSWVLYDVGNSAYVLLASTLIPIYFSAIADPNSSAVVAWGYASTVASLVLALLMLFFFGGMKTTSLIFAFICCAGLFALSAPLQILLLQNAKGGELLGAAGGQIAFNLGSAVGAYCGGMMLTLGLAYNYVALPAALLSFAAMSSLLLYGRYKRQQVADSPVLAKPLGKLH